MKVKNNTSYSGHNQILNRIRGYVRGRILFPSDFHDLAASNAVRLTLSRLTKEGLLQRLGQGVYLYPKVDAELGILNPSIEDIAVAIAKRDKATIIPTGVYALYKLGLSTQVPTKAVYLTDSAPRQIKVGKRIINFKRTTPKKLLVKGKINQLVIQALTELGEKRITDEVLKSIYVALSKEDQTIIKKDAQLAPAWIAKIMNQYLEQ